MNASADWAHFWEVVQARYGLEHIEGNRDAAQLQVAALPAAQADLGAFLRMLVDKRSEDQWREVLACITIGETYFLRGDAQIHSLRNRVMPELLRLARLEHRPLRIWSAGCSSGEEAYTMAFLALQVATAAEVEVIGTDINDEALARAKQGIYRWHSVRSMSEADRQRFLEPDGDTGGVKVRPEVAARVSFRYQNLVNDPALTGPFDLIAWRNVAIYFSRETARAIGERLVAQLSVGGYLLMGEAESFIDAIGPAVPSAGAGAGFYQRRAKAAAQIVDWQAATTQTPRPTPRHPARVDSHPVTPKREPVPVAPTPIRSEVPDVLAVRRALVRNDLAKARRLALTLSTRPDDAAEGMLALALVARHESKVTDALKLVRKTLLVKPDYVAAMILAVELDPQGAPVALKRRLWLMLHTLAPDRVVDDCLNETARDVMKRLAPSLGVSEGGGV